MAALVLVTAGCGWTQWGGSPERRGTASFSGGSPSAIAGWVAHEVTDVPAAAPTAVMNGLVFHVADGRLRALDVNTDAVVWAAELPQGSVAGTAPAGYGTGANTTVFVTVSGPVAPVLLGFDVGGVRNCNAALLTCRPVFTAQLGSTPAPVSPVLVSGDRVLANGGSALFAFDARGQTNCATALGTATCAPLWSAPVGTTASGVGPAATAGMVYDVGTVGGSPLVHAIDARTGASIWTGALGAAPGATPSIGYDGRVFVPAGAGIRVFAGAGCGASSCAPDFTLVKRAADPTGAVLATPAIDGSDVYATATNGILSVWPAAGCGADTCVPTRAAVANAPVGGSTTYRQSPVIADGILYLLAQRAVSGTDHVFLVAANEATLAELKAWDLGSAGYGAGLTNASISGGIVYAPVADGLDAVGPAPIRPLASLSVSPLTLSPAFDPSIFDYSVRCAAGTNNLTIAMAAVPNGKVRLIGPTVGHRASAQTIEVPVLVNQAAVVEAADAQGRTASYWIRCLPPDFPAISATLHPAAGVPTPGWYVIGNGLAPAGAARYAMILDTHGTPVWYKRAAGNAQNVTPVGPNAVAFLPTATGGFGTDPNGRYDVYDLLSRSATPTSAIRTVGTPTDLHELQTLPNGDHLMLSYPLKRGVDLTGLPGAPSAGPNSTIADCVVQDVDRQGNLVWQWTASDHFDPITETTSPAPTVVGAETVYDVFHCNSIDPNPNGNVLVSARHLNAVFEIRRSDGKVLWKMGGTPANHDGAAIIAFTNDPLNGIVQQHDARYLPNGHVSVYDNRANESARAVEFAVDLAAKTATPVFSYSQPESQASCCMGSFRTYPDGHRVVGWGYLLFQGRAFTELDAAGNDVLDIGLAVGNATYRAVKVPPTFYDTATLRLTAGT